MLRIITGKATSGRSSLLIKEASIADQDITYSSMVRVVRERRFAEALALTRPQAFIDDFDLFGLTPSLMSAIRDREQAGLETTVVIRWQTTLEILVDLSGEIDIHSWFHCWQDVGEFGFAQHDISALIRGISAQNGYAEVR